jgi:hypothetical protein
MTSFLTQIHYLTLSNSVFTNDMDVENEPSGKNQEKEQTDQAD